MRKTLPQAILAAFCAILCALSGMGGGGMNLASRVGAWAKGEPMKTITATTVTNYGDQILNAFQGLDIPKNSIFVKIKSRDDLVQSENLVFATDVNGGLELGCMRWRDGVVNGTPSIRSYDNKIFVGDVYGVYLKDW